MRRNGPAQDGTLLVDTSVLVNVVTPYLTVRLTLSPSEMLISWPRTILGLIPVGREELRLHPESVRSIRLTPLVFWARLAIVPVLVVLPVVTGAPLPVAVVCLFLAIVFLIAAQEQIVIPTDRQGPIHGNHLEPVPLELEVSDDFRPQDAD